jgi:hypothetical protein
MSKTIRLGMVCTVLVLALATCLRAQGAKELASIPMPTQISAAKTVFISNAGADAHSLARFVPDEDPNRLYDEFYADMKSWGRYQLVGAPADADLVLEIGLVARISNCSPATYDAQLRLTIFDAKTHFILWSFVEPVEIAYLEGTRERNFKRAMANLVADIKKLAGQTVAASPKPSPNTRG